MREIIAPEDRKGIYYDEIRAEDLIIMGRKPDNIAGCISLDEGILAGLWRLSVETGLGLTVDVRRVPLPQTYIDKCNRENINPYEQPLDLSIFVAHPVSEYHIVKDLRVIGYLTEKKVCKLINGDRESFLAKEKRDHE